MIGSVVEEVAAYTSGAETTTFCAIALVQRRNWTRKIVCEMTWCLGRRGSTHPGVATDDSGTRHSGGIASVDIEMG